MMDYLPWPQGSNLSFSPSQYSSKQIAHVSYGSPMHTNQHQHHSTSMFLKAYKPYNSRGLTTAYHYTLLQEWKSKLLLHAARLIYQSRKNKEK